MAVTDAGRVSLLPCASWDVNGGPDPREWYYRVDVYAPSSTETVRVEAAGIVHSMWAHHSEEPWRGRAPWQLANLSAGLLAGLERALANEAGTPHGQIVPQPNIGPDLEDDKKALQLSLEGAIAALEGGLGFVPTTAAAGPDAPPSDWKVSRLGADPPASLIGLREQVELSIFGACGIPAALAVGRNDGTLARESWRRFVVGAVEPMANELAGVLSEALETPVSFNFRSLWAHDLVGRVTAYDKLTKAGMPPAQARIISGLSEVD